MNKNLKKVAYLTIPVLGLALISGGTALAAPQDENGRKFFNRIELTQEQKDVLTEARELHKSGDNDGARALLQANDIRPPHKGKRGGNEDARAAVKANDYNAFVTATENAPFADNVTQTFFDTLTQAQQLREAGEYEAAKELVESLGLKHRGHKK